MTDSVTRKWIRNESDEKAARNGCRFDPTRGEFVIEWCKKYLRLYEGEWAGEPVDLSHDWQYEITMRLFGWIRHSEKWGRDVRRFRAASVWVPKKNKKSPTLAAWGLFLFAGDGEQGQKVYLAAKDGAQAREICGKHMIEMAQSSEELLAECTINKNLMQVTHLPTKSIIKPISSANISTQQSKEGLNGSVLIDETHVVDRAFVERIERAGISRSEPLQIEVSTVGDDPDSYARERYDYGKKVEDGTFDDERLLFSSYEAPQDLSDSDLDDDPAKYGRLSNPAWNHTIDPEEYLDDYNRSKVSLSRLSKFKMYRLNIWQQTSSPWLKLSDWDACRRDFTEDSLRGKPCWAGLDLSKTRDLTALALIFKGDEPDEYKLLTYFWIAEDAAREKNHLVPFLAWADASNNNLTLSPGNVIDYGFLRAQFRKLAKKFKIQELAFDPWGAEETSQAIEQGVMDDAGKTIEEGTGVPRIAFTQTIANYAGPSEEFERLVIAHKIHHNHNPVLNWQVGHVQVRPDANNNIRPLKPKRGDHRKIDGIVASVMGLARATIAKSPKRSVYEDRGLLTTG